MRIYSYSNKPTKVEKISKKKGWFWRRWTKRQWLTYLFRVVAAGVLFIAIVFLYYTRDLPDPNKLLTRQVPESTKIFARDGSLLYEIHGEVKRTLVNMDQISPNIKQATVAIEDKNFYKEGGVSLTGIARAVIIDILTGKKTQGGSTITQQFVKNAILTNDKSWDRKIREIILAIAIDARFSKDQILQFYLNEIPYGCNAYGVE